MLGITADLLPHHPRRGTGRRSRTGTCRWSTQSPRGWSTGWRSVRDVTDPALYPRLARKLARRRRPLYYLEMPPALFAPIVEQLAAAHLVERARVAVEKPSGHDPASARELNARLHQVLEEGQILRVDHFLGKEPVIEIEYIRFANFALSELWHRDSVAAIQITMAEDFGIADRGRFYDQVGALRDVVQNHLLQVLALVAMDPPVGSSADDLCDKKAEVLRAMPAVEVRDYVRGQWAGYQQVPGVASGSTTETFAALRLEIDNWRWAGVPIFIRAGKQLPVRATEVRRYWRPWRPACCNGSCGSTRPTRSGRTGQVRAV